MGIKKLHIYDINVKIGYLGKCRLKPEKTLSTGTYSEKTYKKCLKNRLRTKSGPGKEIAGGR